MKKYILLFCLLSVSILIAGCGETTVKDEGATVTMKDAGENKAEITIESDNGDAKIEVKSGNTDSWCAEGSEWNMAGEQGDAKMVIEGIVSSGKYEGYCHVTYDVNQEGNEANVDYYFNEEGSGYQVMEMNGQTFESEWSS